MQYHELKNRNDIGSLIRIIEDQWSGLVNIIPASDFETTMAGRKVLTIFYRLEPVVKVEGEETLVKEFYQQLRQTMEAGSSKQ